MEERDRNKVSLWRKFDRTEKQPVAKGDGVIGECDFRIVGSMWPSRKGTKSDGKPWQVWNVSLQPANDEDRVLLAVPRELADKVREMIASAVGDTAPVPPELPAQDSVEEPQGDLPF